MGRLKCKSSQRIPLVSSVNSICQLGKSRIRDLGVFVGSKKRAGRMKATAYREMLVKPMITIAGLHVPAIY